MGLPVLVVLEGWELFRLGVLQGSHGKRISLKDQLLQPSDEGACTNLKPSVTQLVIACSTQAKPSYMAAGQASVGCRVSLLQACTSLLTLFA